MAKILVVDDDTFVRDLYRRIFTYEGYEVDVAADGAEGLAKTRSFKPDLLLLDIMMPDKDGLEVTRELKADRETKDITIVMLTNQAQDDSIKEAFKLGAAGYLLKTELNPEQIRLEVKNFLTPENPPSA